MESIWISKMVFKPAGPMTFRRMPSGILHIMSYPFMPPTTMSGFLTRLMMIAEGDEWPDYTKDWHGKGEYPNAGKEFTLSLGKEYRTLGAFPRHEHWHIHKTRRHGPKDFKHREFSELFRTNHDANYQLHHWDYLFCDELTGWVASKTKDPLLRLKNLLNYGGKAGKEGYLVVSSVEDPKESFLKHGEYKPLGLVPQPDRPQSGTFYNLYSHFWKDDYLWSDRSLGGVVGYSHVGAWWNVEEIGGEYWGLDDDMGFPAHAPDAFLTGEVDKFWEGGHE